MEARKLALAWDMETSDPDDFLTLLLLLGHPRVDLRAVTLTPGSTAQVGLVRLALSWFGRALPVGAWNLEHPKPCVSSWHRRAFGEFEPSRDARPGWQVLSDVCDGDLTLVTGAALKNLGRALDEPGFALGRLVAQGGFAGEGVVPTSRQLEKFRGRTTCPTFNLNGDPKSALKALSHSGIGARYFVSKNVCHGVIYDDAMHARVGALRHGARSLELIWQGMEAFLDRKRPTLPRVNEAITDPHVRLVSPDGVQVGVVPTTEALGAAKAVGLDLVEVDDGSVPPVCRIKRAPPEEDLRDAGKKLHDPLAACCAIEPSIGTWAEVELYREKGEWGSRLREGTRTWIITDYDPERFFSVLTER